MYWDIITVQEVWKILKEIRDWISSKDLTAMHEVGSGRKPIVILVHPVTIGIPISDEMSMHNETVAVILVKTTGTQTVLAQFSTSYISNTSKSSYTSKNINSSNL